MAVREIRRNTMRSTLTTLGMVIGVGSVITMVTLGNGATSQITADISKMGTNLLIVSPGSDRRGPTAATAASLEAEDAHAIQREITTVADVAPASSRGMLAVVGNRNWSTVVTGTTNEYFRIRGYTMAKGALFSDVQLQGSTPVCIVGDTVKRELFLGRDPIGETLRIGTLSCTVVGAVASKGQSSFGQDQDDFVIVPLTAFQHRVAGSNDIGTIFVTATRDSATLKAKHQISLLMRDRRRLVNGEADDFVVQDMKELGAALGSVTGALTGLLGAIAGVSLVVGGIGIMNIMLVSVTERTREIGIRLAIGALGREVLLQFLVEAVTLATLGGALGVVFGLGASFAAASALKLPFAILPQIIVIAFAFSATIGIVFGYLPARKASRLNPIEALRHE